MGRKGHGAERTGDVINRIHVNVRSETMMTMNGARHPEYQYLDLLQELLDHGDKRMDRTGVGTLALFGREMRFDLTEDFPILTTKRVYWKTAFKEMLWMLSGGTNIRELLEQNVHIWTDWPLARYRRETGEDVTREEFETRVLGDQEFADRWGDLGPVYGKQWRSWRTSDGREIDQLEQVVEEIRTNPTSRRIIWEGWNVGELDQMALPPCHKHYQVFVTCEGKLSLAMVQRSCDYMAGYSFNQVSLSLLAYLLAKETDLEPGEIVWFGMDVHLYLNHMEQAKEQLSREPRAFPKLKIKRKAASLFDYRIEDFELVGYNPYPPIALPIAV